MLENLLAAEGVDEGCPAGARGAADHQAELDTFLDILLSARLKRLSGVSGSLNGLEQARRAKQWPRVPQGQVVSGMVVQKTSWSLSVERGT